MIVMHLKMKKVHLVQTYTRQVLSLCSHTIKTFVIDIESKLRRIEEDPEGCGTSHLYSSIQGVTTVANRAFAPLLERHAQAEKIRSVQGMLQRFRTLFNLPSAIRGNIN